MIFRIVLVLIFSALTQAQLVSVSAAQANAQFCGLNKSADWPKIRDRLVGTWTARHHAGYMIMPGLGAMAFPAGAPEPIEVWSANGKLLASGGQPKQTVELKWANEGPWGWRDEAPAGAKPLLTETDFSLTLGRNCEAKDIPRLIGRTTVNQEGTTLNFTLRLFVMTRNSA